MKSARYGLLCLPAAVLLFTCSAAAQSLGEVAQRTKEQRNGATPAAFKLDDRDIDPRLAAQEVLEYEVTAERWKHFVAADIWVNRTLEKDPALMERLSGLKADTARALERFLIRELALARALASAGSDPHEYAFTQVALTVALILNADERVVANASQLPAATQANMALVKAHAQDLKGIEALTREARAHFEK
jgi:hypothetical protein